MTRHPHLGAVVCAALLSCSISSTAPAQPAPAPREVVDDDLLAVFRERQVDGAFVLTDLDAGTTVVVGSRNADLRVTPASTFKIPNALIALDTGVATGPDFPLPWDGVSRTMPEWNREHTLASAIRFSVVWYFRELARRIGAARMQRYVDAFQYGNRDLSGGVDRFWLESSLRITPREQVAFMSKLARGALPLRPATMARVRDMIVLERDGATVLSGKTGSGEQDGRTIGWLVGTFTREQGSTTRRFAYATLILAPAGQLERLRPLRLEITKALLRRRGA